MASFSELARDALKSMGVTATIAADAQIVEFSMADQTVITLSDMRTNDRMALSALVTFLPGREEALDLLQFALEANLALGIAEGATFTLDPGPGKLILMKPMPLSTTTADGLVAAVGRFMTVAQACRQAVRDRPASSAGTEPPAMSESHTLFRA